MPDAALASSSDNTAVQAGVGTAQLTSELDDDGPYTISGIALGADDITVGSTGVKKKWPAEELERAASTLEGKPLVRDHQNNTDGRIGTVTKAYYQEGVGVKYEAEIAPHYSELAQDVATGIQEVSARAYHDPVSELEEDPDSGALVCTNVVFDNLSVVSQGASPSNTAEIGGLDTSDAVAMAQGPAGGAIATLEAGAPRTAELSHFSEGDWVKGDSSGGTWHGKIRDMKTDGCFSDRIDGDQKICAGDDEPVYLIENYDPEDGEFTDTMVAHKHGSVSEWDHEEARKAYVDVMAAELEASEDELDEVYSDWSDAVNMSASELESWADHPCSDKASKDPEAVRKRNMHLLETDKSDWGSDEIEDAKRTISFVARMADEENEPDAPKDGPSGCPSEWAISLLNWAHNPFNSMPEVPDEMEEENAMNRAMSTDDIPDMSDMPCRLADDTPEWSEGDIVRWQVEPDLFGKIVHVDEEKHIAMVEIMGLEDGEPTSTGFTITAGFSDIKPMKMPSMTSEQSDWEKKDEMMAAFRNKEPAEMASVNGMDINGTVMWDGNMGVIADFMMEDGDLMVAIDLLEKEDGQFTKTGKTETMPLHEAESMSVARGEAVAELESAWHTPDWSGTDSEREWSKPAMEDFDTDDMSEIDDHFIVSDTGEWPPENYGDLSLPVVFPNGDLSLDGLDSAHQMAGQVEGISDDMADSLQSKINGWAKEHFDEPVANEEMQAGPDDDARGGQSNWAVAALKTDDNSHSQNTMTNTIDYATATDDDIEEMSMPVVIEQDDVEALRAKADEAEELSEKLESVNSSIEELSDNQQLLDEVDEDALAELQEYDEAVVLQDSEYEELQGLVDEIGTVFADELAEYSPFDSEELQDRFTPLELRAKVEGHDEADVTGELGASESDPEPEGGSKSPEELESGGEDTSELSEEDLREEVAEHLEAGEMYRQAEKVRSGDIALEEMGIDVDALN